MQKDAYTKKARQIIAHARTQAESLGHSFIGTEHLILSMLSDGSNVGAALLRTHRVPLNRFQQAVRSEVGSAEPSVLTESAVTPALRRILLKAEKQRPSGAIISSEVLLRTVLEDEQCGAAMLLRGMGVSLHTLRGACGQELPDDAGEIPLFDRKACPMLAQYAHHLTDPAAA